MPITRRQTARLVTGVALSAALRPRWRARVTPAEAQAEQSILYPAGWNLVAGPDGARFDGVQGDLLTLGEDGGYEAVPVAEGATAGQGYWAYFPVATTLTPPQAADDSVQIDAPAGSWLMLGNPGSQTAQLQGADTAFIYDPIAGYVATDLVPPGKGALAYSASGGVISIAPAANTIVAVAPAATASAEPALAAAEAPDLSTPIQVLASGFGQSRMGGPVSAGVLLRNSGATALDLTPIAFTAYDAHGTVIAAGETPLHLIGAGETTGLVHRMTVTNMSGVAQRVDVRAGTGRATGDPLPGSLSFDRVTLTQGRSALAAARPQASATLTSTFSTDLGSVHLNALAYDAGGNIVGGGSSTERLVPASGSIGVVVTLDVSGTPARAEFYAQLA